MQVANQSHPMTVTESRQSLDVSTGPITLDRDIILDIDLPAQRAATVASIEKQANSSNHAVLLSFAPRLSDFMKIITDSNETNSELIFIGRCDSLTLESFGCSSSSSQWIVRVR
jgi:hypothetical protein